MPSRKTTRAAKANAARMPSIPRELLDQIEKQGPMTAETIQQASMAFKKALIERAMSGELSHHLGYGPGQDKPKGAVIPPHRAVHRPGQQRRHAPSRAPASAHTPNPASGHGQPAGPGPRSLRRTGNIRPQASCRHDSLGHRRAPTRCPEHFRRHAQYTHSARHDGSRAHTDHTRHHGGQDRHQPGSTVRGRTGHHAAPAGRYRTPPATRQCPSALPEQHAGPRLWQLCRACDRQCRAPRGPRRAQRLFPPAGLQRQ